MLRTTLFFTLSLLLLLSAAQPLLSDNRDKQSGFIDITLDEKKKKRTYEEISTGVVEKFETFYNSISGKTPSEFTTPPTFDNDQLRYLATVHYHCTVRSGACPHIPQAMYEMELVRSYLAGSPSCKILPKFWKTWIESDMEKRVEHKLKVVHFNKRTQYKENVRPKFIRCLTSVKELPEDKVGLEEYLVQRYKTGSENVNAPKKMALYLKKINSKIPNIYAATGLVGPS